MLAPLTLTPNVLEGRELLSPQSAAVDTSATEPVLYVADTGNHRVLAFRNPGSTQFLQTADFVIGQRDMTTSAPNFPGTTSQTFPSGLNSPTGVAVDRQGNLFVLDYANNRILRFPKPHQQTGQINADLVIGQPNLTSRNPNQAASGTGVPRNDTLRFAASSTAWEYAALAIDPEGNLWVTDSGNHRVVRYPATDVSGSSNTGSSSRTIRADYVLGQTDFTSATANAGRTNVQGGVDLQNKLKMRFPAALAVDAGGNLYVSDELGRVLYWTSGFRSDNLGKAASRLLGLYIVPAGELPAVANDYILSWGYSGTTYNFGPKGLTVIDGRLFVADTAFSRVTRYGRPSEWPAENSTQISPRMAGVFGQPDFLVYKENRGSAEPSADALQYPTALTYNEKSRELYVVDTGNHRVLVASFDEAGGGIAPARAALGQIGFEFRSPNFIEGREFASGTVNVTTSQGTFAVPIGPHAAIDYTSTPARLYIADTGNNRILGFADARRAAPGAKADIVIGQVDFYRNLINSPDNNRERPNESGLYLPSSVAVDSEGNLFVADTGNGRVLRFPRPFDQGDGMRRADLVIGQSDFNARNFEATERTLARPASIAFTGNDSLVVADMAQHRVLVFARGDFANGTHASRVIGQPDFTSSAAGNTENRLALPLQVSVDADDNLYVADYGNNRIQIFYRVSAFGDGNGVDASNSLSVQSSTILGVTASKRKSQFWIVDAGTRTTFGRVLRIGDRDSFFLSGTATADAGFQTYSPRALVLDEKDNVIVLDGANRATFHFPQLNVVNWANGFPRVAPGMIGRLRVPGVALGGSGTEVNGSPAPLEMDGYEVVVNGARSPVLKVTDEDLRLIVPKSAPGVGNGEFLVRKTATGEIVAHAFVNMTAVSPAALMEVPGQAVSNAIAFNDNGQPNSASSPAVVGSDITVLMTGYGFLETLPDDGVASGTDVPSAGVLRAFLRTSTTAVTEATVVSSTLDPERPGVWRLKVKLPQVPVAGTYPFTVLYKNVPSDNLPGTNPAVQVRAVIYVSR